MKKTLFIIIAIVSIFACTREEKDMTPPEILSVGNVACPMQCEEFSKGGVIEFTYAFKDDVELGSYNIEIHSNADHHTHGTEAAECSHDEDHDHGAGNKPWVYNKDFSIPSGQKYFAASQVIPIPADIDEGEYHFMIRVTDASGWQQLRSLEIFIED